MEAEGSLFGVVFKFLNSTPILRLRQMKQRLWAVGGDASRDCRCPVRLKRKRQRPGYRQVVH